MRLINETQKGQDSPRAILDQKEYKKLLEQVKDGVEWIKAFIKSDTEERLH